MFVCSFTPQISKWTDVLWLFPKKRKLSDFADLVIFPVAPPWGQARSFAPKKTTPVHLLDPVFNIQYLLTCYWLSNRHDIPPYITPQIVHTYLAYVAVLSSTLYTVESNPICGLTCGSFNLGRGLLFFQCFIFAVCKLTENRLPCSLHCGAIRAVISILWSHLFILLGNMIRGLIV